jgi:hypothetical protein
MSKPMKLRKIPLEPLIEILTNLFEEGADYIDISGEESADKDSPQDIIKITIKPEYLSTADRDFDDDDEEEDYEEDINDRPNKKNDKLSDNDINDLI